MPMFQVGGGVKKQPSKEISQTVSSLDQFKFSGSTIKQTTCVDNSSASMGLKVTHYESA